MSDAREVLELDVVIVGAGPAGLAAALHLQGLLQRHNEAVRDGQKKGPDLSEAMIAVLEKGTHAGDHVLSGAVMDPRVLSELIPDYAEKGCPGIPCRSDDIIYLRKRGHVKLPFTPDWLQNEGNRILSIQHLVRWMSERLEEMGGDLFPSFPAAELLMEEGRVVGVRTGDKGVDRDGARRSNFEPGMDIHAKVTILAEGSRGSLTKELVRSQHLDEGCNPQVYATGVKEVWRVTGCDRLHKGRVIHTMGHPLGARAYGGGFIYFMGDDLVQVGFVTGLGSPDPRLDPHRLFQEFKLHPFVRGLLAGGEMIRYGAKSIPVGGWWSRPRSYTDGCLIVGDAGSNLNAARLKGIHLAMKTGMLAAETALEALCRGDSSLETLAGFEQAVARSWVRKELFSVRNVHQALARGLPWSVFDLALQKLTGGRGLRNRYPCVADHLHMRPLSRASAPPPPLKFDGQLTFDKLTEVFHSGTIHEENQPCHLKVTVSPDHCRTTCAEEYGNPCQYFCPASVYEMVEDSEQRDSSPVLRINAANCVHCKTCDIMDPYEAIEWTTPEGGGGPSYTDL